MSFVVRCVLFDVCRLVVIVRGVFFVACSWDGLFGVSWPLLVVCCLWIVVCCLIVCYSCCYVC